jgi:hypothetical protein
MEQLGILQDSNPASLTPENKVLIACLLMKNGKSDSVYILLCVN